MVKMNKCLVQWDAKYNSFKVEVDRNFAKCSCTDTLFILSVLKFRYDRGSIPHISSKN